MQSVQLAEATRAEERLVAELELLGIHYLSRLTSERAQSVRPPAALLADLVQQPSARVRAAVIAVLLLHPHFARAMPAALSRLPLDDQVTLQLFYTAARLLQQEHAEQLRPLAPGRRLPKRYAADLGLPGAAPVREQLAALAERHRQATRSELNWAGTYESVARSLVRSWEAARRWNR